MIGEQDSTAIQYRQQRRCGLAYPLGLEVDRHGMAVLLVSGQIELRNPGPGSTSRLDPGESVSVLFQH